MTGHEDWERGTSDENIEDWNGTYTERIWIFERQEREVKRIEKVGVGNGHKRSSKDSAPERNTSM